MVLPFQLSTYNFYRAPAYIPGTLSKFHFLSRKDDWVGVDVDHMVDGLLGTSLIIGTVGPGTIVDNPPGGVPLVGMFEIPKTTADGARTFRAQASVQVVVGNFRENVVVSLAEQPIFAPNVVFFDSLVLR